MNIILAASVVLALIAVVVAVNVTFYRQRKDLTPQQRKKIGAEIDRDNQTW